MRELFEQLICAVIMIALLIGGVLAFVVVCNWVGYALNPSECKVLVNGEKVYEGRCHYVTVQPLGEYGNSKKVSIYSDKGKLIQIKKYISEDVEITDVSKD